MISFIRGNIVTSTDDGIIIENNGIGYKVFTSTLTTSRLNTQKGEVTVYTHISVREDDISLYGFSSMEEISMFNLLISVSGIGAKSALVILATFSPMDLMLAIMSDDYDTLSKAKGIGKKTAQRMALELRDKIKNTQSIEIVSKNNDTLQVAGSHQSVIDAIDALTALGYSRSEATKCVAQVADNEMTAQEIIKASLKLLSKF